MTVPLEMVVDVAGGATALVARLRTRLGREVERTILLNTRGVLAESDAHVVEQLVGVSKGGERSTPPRGSSKEPLRAGFF